MLLHVVYRLYQNLQSFIQLHDTRVHVMSLMPTESMVCLVSTVQQQYVEIYTESHKNLAQKHGKHGQKFSCVLKYNPTITTELIFMKLKLALHLFVKNFNAISHNTPTNGLVIDTTLQMDRWMDVTYT